MNLTQIFMISDPNINIHTASYQIFYCMTYNLKHLVFSQ